MKKLNIIAVIALLVASCQPATQITATWKNADANIDRDINTILVTALTGRTTSRQAIEDDIAAALADEGYHTIKSIEVMPPTLSSSQTLDREDLLSKISNTGADAILTVALIDEKTETRYVPGNYSYAPVTRFGYYGTFWGYYNTWYPTLYDPGYYEAEKVYFLETNLYDARTEQLLWSAQSETYSPTNLPDFAEDFSEAVVSRLESEGVLNGDGTGLASERKQPE